MHALTMLHNILTESCSGIHAKRITSLLATVEAVVSGSRLALSDLGRDCMALLPSSTTSSESTGCSVIAHCMPRRQGYMKHSPGSVWRV